MPVGHLLVLYEKMSIQVFYFKIGLFVFLLLSCINCLYMLDINPLLVISFANIFSHLVSCLCALLMVYFAVQKLLTLIQFSSVQSLSRVRLFVTPWITVCQASLSITNSQSLPIPMSIESVMPSSIYLLLLLYPLV